MLYLITFFYKELKPFDVLQKTGLAKGVLPVEHIGAIFYTLRRRSIITYLLGALIDSYLMAPSTLFDENPSHFGVKYKGAIENQ